MAIVVDASVAIAWRLRDQDGTPFADAVVERIAVEEAVVPDLFWHEVRSVLLREERNRRIEVGAADDHMQAIRLLPLSTDGDQDDGQIAALARRHGLSGYDAAYLETAMRRGAKLATLDRKLAAAAVGEGVSIGVD